MHTTNINKQSEIKNPKTKLQELILINHAFFQTKHTDRARERAQFQKLLPCWHRPELHPQNPWEKSVEVAPIIPMLGRDQPGLLAKCQASERPVKRKMAGTRETSPEVLWASNVDTHTQMYTCTYMYTSHIISHTCIDIHTNNSPSYLFFPLFKYICIKVK